MQPVPVEAVVLTFYLPVTLITTVVILGFMRTKNVPRWAGATFIALYLIFVIGGWIASSATPG